MKRGTPEHPKTCELEAALDLEKWGAVGVLETLWHFVGKFTPAGDIGKYSNTAIARGIGWRGNADSLIKALVDMRWLDVVSHCRLIVHDWSEHADDATHMKLCRAKQYFADGRRPQFKGISGKEREMLEIHFVATPYLRNDYAVPQPYILPSPPLPPPPIPSPRQQSCSNPPTAAGCERDGDLKCRTSQDNGSGTIISGSAVDTMNRTSIQQSGNTPCAPCGITSTSPPESNAKDLNDDEPREEVSATTIGVASVSETLTVSGSLAALPPAEDTNQWTKPTVAKAPDPLIVTINGSPMTPAEKLYSHYRKKVGRAKAIVEAQKALKKVTAKLGNADAAFALLEEAVMAYSVSPTGRGKYCLDPERWFKYERWTDDRVNWERPDDDRQDSRLNSRSSGGYQSGNQQADIDAGWAAADARDAAEQALAVGTGSGPPEILDVPH